MRELSLFTGAGGGLLGSLILGWRTVAAVEIDPYCQRVLCARGGYVADADTGLRGRGLSAEQGQWRESTAAPSAPFPVYGDVRAFHPVPGSCDIVTGGFPCQPFSQAGKRLGEDDPRNMWPHAVRVLRESGAPLGFFENVPGLLSSGYFGTVLGDLAEAGFDAEWCVLGADDVGAPHRRKRLWILAYSPGNLRRASRHDGRVALDGAGDRGELADAASIGKREPADEADSVAVGRQAWPESGNGSSPWWCDPADVPDAEGNGRREGRPESDGRRPESEQSGGAHADAVDDALCRRHGASEDEICPGRDGSELSDEWLSEPYVGRVAHGVASRVDRLRALGNGQVPQAMARAFTYLAREAGLP